MLCAFIDHLIPLLTDPFFNMHIGIDSPLAYFPQTGSLLTTKMTFMERVKNTILYLVSLSCHRYCK